MAQRKLPNASGRQKRQARLLRSRLESAGMPKTEARTRAAAKTRRTMKDGGTRVVSKKKEAAAMGKQKTPRSTKRRK